MNETHRRIFVRTTTVAVLLSVSALSIACAASSTDTAVEIPSATSQPVASSPPAIVSATSAPVASVEPQATATAAAELPPYPDDAIRRGQNEAQKTCMQLVYKSGCDQLRTGKVTLRVALRDDGTVLSAHVSSNDVKTDPKVVEDCLLDSVEKLHFDPPKDTASSFSIKFILSDKC